MAGAPTRPPLLLPRVFSDACQAHFDEGADDEGTSDLDRVVVVGIYALTPAGARSRLARGVPVGAGLAAAGPGASVLVAVKRRWEAGAARVSLEQAATTATTAAAPRRAPPPAPQRADLSSAASSARRHADQAAATARRAVAEAAASAAGAAPRRPTPHQAQTASRFSCVVPIVRETDIVLAPDVVAMLAPGVGGARARVAMPTTLTDGAGAPWAVAWVCDPATGLNGFVGAGWRAFAAAWGAAPGGWLLLESVEPGPRSPRGGPTLCAIVLNGQGKTAVERREGVQGALGAAALRAVAVGARERGGGGA